MLGPLFQDDQPAMERLRRASLEVLGDFLGGYVALSRLIALRRLRREWRLFRDQGREVLIDRARRELQLRGADPMTEELGIACVEHASEAIGDAFQRIERFRFSNVESFLATLRLHAELSLLLGFEPLEWSETN